MNENKDSFSDNLLTQLHREHDLEVILTREKSTMNIAKQVGGCYW